MQIDKPANQPITAILFRAKRVLSGRFAFGLSFEVWPRTRGTAALTWCGVRGVVVLDGIRWYARSLRLPAHIGEADQFVLQVHASVRLKLSLSFHSQDAAEEDFEIATGADAEAATTECADGSACEMSAPGEDTLLAGYLPAAPNQRRPLFVVRAVRPCRDAAVMRLTLRRPAGAAEAKAVHVRTTVGNERRLVIIAAGWDENSVSFRLRPTAGENSWPVTIDAGSAVEWSGVVRRGFDEIILPAFSMEEV